MKLEDPDDSLTNALAPDECSSPCSGLNAQNDLPGKVASSDTFLRFHFRNQDRTEVLHIKKSALDCIEGSRLFYPCSRGDLEIPLMMFAPYVREFWFVDLIYGQGFEGYPPTDFSLSDPAVEKLTNLSCFRYLDRTISGPLIADIERYCGLRKRYRWSRKPEFFGYQSIEPCLCTETYLHHPSRRHIKIVRRRGFGFTTLRTYIKSIGVFFYRRDSTMEEGSGDLWLTIDHLTELLPKLKNGGLIVTDGSNHGDHHHGKRNNLDYSPLWRHHGNRDSDPEALPESFNDRHSNRFECVGFAGFGLGPTWIWQVWKPDVQPKEEPVKQEKRKPSKKTVRRRKPELQHNKPIFESEGE